MDKNTIVIAIDHGWSACKTSNFVFCSGVREITTEPAIYDNVVQYNGRYFKIGSERLKVKDINVNILLYHLYQIYPNAYYKFLKNRKAGYYIQKQDTLHMIEQIYHEHDGVDGHRAMQVYLERKGKKYSKPTIHKYMNRELGLKSVTRRKKPGYRKGKAHKVFRNILEQDFDCDEINTKWCTDFTYLFLSDGTKRYKCTIINLHDRSVIASITDKNITSDLAKRALKKVIDSLPPIKGVLILHSNQGRQYTSKEFVEYCEANAITQSMSKAGCPYDNVPMERYFNTLKNELINLHSYVTEETLYKAIEEFAYTKYNHMRPHSYNGYKTPFETRYIV